MQEQNAKLPFCVIHSAGARRLLVLAVCAPLLISIIRMIEIGEQSLMDVRSVIGVIAIGWSIHIIVAFFFGWKITIGTIPPLEPNDTAGRVGALIMGILVYLMYGLYLFEKLGLLAN